jgi:hypothetical protein
MPPLKSKTWLSIEPDSPLSHHQLWQSSRRPMKFVMIIRVKFLYNVNICLLALPRVCAFTTVIVEQVFRHHSPL